MKCDRAHLVGELLSLLDKGDQAALVDFVARHPKEMGSFAPLMGLDLTQEPPAMIADLTGSAHRV